MKSVLYILLSTLFLASCATDNDDVAPAEVTTTFTFSHYWDGALVTNVNFDAIQYTNANGELMSIERLRYLISDITFTSNNNEDFVFDAHNLVDVTNGSGLSFGPTHSIPKGNYTVSFTFGLDNEDNSENYPDLNSESFNVPVNLGGGYHYMQLDGKFINDNAEEQGYNYHAIRAVDNAGTNPTFPQNTFLTVNLGTITINSDTEIGVEMNIAEWFKNPNLWDLNILNQSLMPNSAAQIMMSENGKNVFSLGAVTP